MVLRLRDAPNRSRPASDRDRLREQTSRTPRSGGGTDCSAPMQQLNARKTKASLVIYVSDNESWVDAGRGRGTALMTEWAKFRRLNPQARLVCGHPAEPDDAGRRARGTSWTAEASPTMCSK